MESDYLAQSYKITIGINANKTNDRRNRAATKDFPFQTARLRRSGSRLGSAPILCGIERRHCKPD